MSLCTIKNSLMKLGRRRNFNLKKLITLFPQNCSSGKQLLVRSDCNNVFLEKTVEFGKDTEIKSADLPFHSLLHFETTALEVTLLVKL